MEKKNVLPSLQVQLGHWFGMKVPLIVVVRGGASFLLFSPDGPGIMGLFERKWYPIPLLIRLRL
jgi:hypothetical protein